MQYNKFTTVTGRSMPTQPFPQRKSPRLQGYDYSQEGAYFVTICTHRRAHWFGEVANYEMQLSEIGVIAQACWSKIPNHYPHVELDHFVVMPNHVHGIIVLHDLPDAIGNIVGTPYMVSENTSSETTSPQKHPILGVIIGTYKAAVTRQSRLVSTSPEGKFWQARYHDHIIRDERALNYIRRYMQNNPAIWQKDIFYSQ